MGCPIAVCILVYMLYSLRYGVSHDSLYSGLYVLFIEIWGVPWQSVFWSICFIHWDMGCPMTVCILVYMFYSLGYGVSHGSLYSGLYVLLIEIWGVPWQSLFWSICFIRWDIGCSMAVCILVYMFYSLRYGVSHDSLYSGLYVLFIEVWGVPWQSVFWSICFIRWDIGCSMAVCILVYMFHSLRYGVSHESVFWFICFIHWDMGCPMTVCILVYMFYSLRYGVSHDSLYSGLYVLFIEIWGVPWQSVFSSICFIHWDMGCPMTVCILVYMFYSLRYGVSHDSLYSGLYVLFIEIWGVPWQSVFWFICFIHWDMGCPMAVCILACMLYSLIYWVSHGSLYSGLYVVFVDILGVPWQSVFWPVCCIRW